MSTRAAPKRNQRVLPNNCDLNVRSDAPAYCRTPGFQCAECAAWLRGRGIYFAATELNEYHAINAETLCPQHFLYITVRLRAACAWVIACSHLLWA